MRYEFVGGSSHKFWEISVEGASHTVRYGRVGTDGRLQTKTFSDARSANSSAAKLVHQKLKKGYVVEANALRTWLAERSQLLAVFHDYEAWFKVPYAFGPWLHTEDDDPRCAKLSDLGSTGDGSRVAVWHRGPGNDAVVYFGSEGGKGVLTANLLDWVSALALGITFGGFPGDTDFLVDEPSYKFDDYDEDFMGEDEDPARAQHLFTADAATLGSLRSLQAIRKDADALREEFTAFLQT